MLEIGEFQTPLLYHPITPAGPIPTVFDPDGIYPYPSFIETSHRPILKSARFVTLENDSLRVTICPDLGGKVYSLVEKRSGHEVLFTPASIQPVRILPRMSFIPGGIEVSFPISHTPVQLETVAWQSRRIGARAYVWCGERELHAGLQWTVEYSLGGADTFLAQRTYYRNPTPRPQAWMSWSNAAVPARPDTEFHFPNGPVLYHGAELRTIDWASEGPRTAAQLDRMAGFFWLKPDACAFGAFTPSLGSGLYHVAEPASTPGMKLWTYGVGPHEIWGRAASLSGAGYVEIQGGPIRDQSAKGMLQPGQAGVHVEYWIPSLTRLDVHSISAPHPELPPLDEVPWFGWPPRASLQQWLSVTAAQQARRIEMLPAPPDFEQDLWPPSGMDDLGEALEWAISVSTGQDRDNWLFQLSAWMAARGSVEQALETLARSGDDRARALAGRMHLRALNNPARACEAFRAIRSDALALHPQIVVERDLALTELGPATLQEREQWLRQLVNSGDEWVIERRAALLLDQGQPEQARALLQSSRFQLVHQRYARRQLWNRAVGQNTSSLPPNWLGEDDLAVFGAYRQFESRETGRSI
jgi:hypothetical protein